MDALEFLTLVMALGIGGTAAAWDLTRRKIPNWLSGATLACGLVLVAMAGSWELGLQHLYHFVLALVIGVALFGLRWWGGGDAKFYAAVAAWFPLAAFFQLVFWISIAGVVLVIWAFMRRRRKATDEASRTVGVPYGVAIAAGLVLMLVTSFAQS